MSKAKEKKEVTTNQGKKHLFGSSEKSDFILNMSAESAQKLCGVYSIIAVLVLCVITIPYYFTQNIKYGMDESVNRTLYLNEKFIFFISAAVLAVGFVGFIIFLIANMKKQVELKDKPYRTTCGGASVGGILLAFSGYLHIFLRLSRPLRGYAHHTWLLGTFCRRNDSYG